MRQSDRGPLHPLEGVGRDDAVDIVVLVLALEADDLIRVEGGPVQGLATPVQRQVYLLALLALERAQEVGLELDHWDLDALGFDQAPGQGGG